VKVVRDSVTIRSKEGTYYADQRLMEGRNGVELDREKTVLTAVNAKYLSMKTLSLLGNVVLVDTSSVHYVQYFDTMKQKLALLRPAVYICLKTPTPSISMVIH